MNYKEFVPAILSILGITAFAKNDKGVFSITDEQRATLKEKGFGDSFIASFIAALATDFTGSTAQENIPPPVSAPAVNSEREQAIALAVQYANALDELNRMRQTNSATTVELAAAQTKITDLSNQIQTLIKAPESDAGSGSQHGKQNPDNMTANWNDDKQLGGFQGERFSLQDRPYNLRAKAAILASQGIMLPVPMASSTDYRSLEQDLGDFYRVRWQDRLQSFLIDLPSLESIFPLQSGKQDRAVLVNLFLGEFSQADNTASDFDKVVKGNYEFDPEELRMFDVMFNHKFTNLKEMEKTWIGYYNNAGSSVYKMSFIELLLSETARVLHNEREMRRINGVRVNPTLNESGTAMGASDGLYEWLRKKVDGWIDPNRGTVYQIKPFKLGTPTEANIGEYIEKGTKMLPQALIDKGTVRLYMPTQWVTAYHKYNEDRFSQSIDYKADIMYVRNYPSVRIIPVPNAENHNRFIWTIDGNIKLYEDVPGEMYKFEVQLQDWTIKVWSNWRESVWANMVGYKYTNPDEMDYSRQMVFCNDVDLSADYYVPAKKDASVLDASLHTSIVTVANTSLVSITDIANAKPGAELRIKCGSTNFGVQILKTSPNFTLITADWLPKYGDVIRLMKRADGKFIELGRENASSNALMFAPDEATPSLTGGTEFVTGENTGATAITNLLNAIEDVVYTIYGNGTTNASTIANGGNFVLTAAITLSTGASIKLVKSGDGKFYEIARV